VGSQAKRATGEDPDWNSQRLGVTTSVSRVHVLAEMTAQRQVEVGRLFIKLLIAQWVLATVVTLAVPVWDRQLSRAACLVVGTVLAVIPLLLLVKRPGLAATRHVLTVAQMTWSALLIMILGDHAETHYHVFGALVLLALYRDWRVLPTAVAVIALRAVLWPVNVYGPDWSWWSVAEHAGWVLFEVAVLAFACVRGAREMRDAAMQLARLQRTKTIIERAVEDRTNELLESAERYRALVENTEAITFEYDTVARRMLYLAPQATRLLDCSLGDLEDDRFLEDAIYPNDRERVAAQLAELATGKRSWSDPIDCRLQTREGRVVHVRTFLSARAGSRRIRGMTIDFTRQRKLESELQQSQKLESVGRLAAGVAHEINTPIQFIGDSVQFMAQAMEDVMAVVAQQQAIIGALSAGVPAAELAGAVKDASDAADEADLPYIVEELPRAAERALDGVERVGTIVRSMKVFAHPDKADMAPIDLNHAITSTLTIARNEYRYVASVDTQLGALPPVTCFAGEINQVILNIVINAAHAIGEIHAQTGTRGKICVRTAHEGDHVVISIRDTGGGIPDDVRDRIFDPFFTTKDVGQGTGQGLSIARSVIVDRHHGALTFETTPGVGSTFHIRLPVRTAELERRAAA